MYNRTCGFREDEDGISTEERVERANAETEQRPEYVARKEAQKEARKLKRRKEAPPNSEEAVARG